MKEREGEKERERERERERENQHTKTHRVYGQEPDLNTPLQITVEFSRITCSIAMQSPESMV